MTVAGAQRLDAAGAAVKTYRTACVIVLASSTPLGLVGQQAAPLRNHRFCLRSNWETSCDWFPITEIGLGRRLSVVAPNEHSVDAFGQLGLAHQVGPRLAWGITAGLGSGGGGANSTLFTLAPRVRILLGRLAVLDVTTGLLIGETSNRRLSFAQSSGVTTFSDANDARPAFVLDVALNASDWAALFWRVNLFRYGQVTYDRQYLTPGACDGCVQFNEDIQTVSQNGTVATQYLGARVGSYPGLAVGAATLVVFAIFVATYHGSN